jgi:photosystem II stability/assembly factor-like uncharacterized protein
MKTRSALKKYLMVLGMALWPLSQAGADSLTSAAWTFDGPTGLTCPVGFGDVPNGTPFSGAVSRVVVDPRDATGNTVYIAASSGGLFWTENGLSANPTYTSLSDPNQTLSIGALAVDFSQNPPVIYVGTGDPDNTGGVACYNGTGILISKNNGATWQNVPSADNGTHPFTGLGFSRIIVDPRHPNVLLASTGDSYMAGLNPLFMPDTARPQGSNARSNIGVYRSTDSGNTWAQVLAGDTTGGAMEILFDPSGTGTYYSAGRTRAIQSSPDGLTWTPVTGNGLPAASTIYRATMATRNGTQWVLIILNGGSAELFQTTDQGADWTSLALPANNGNFPGKNLGMSYVAAPPNSTSLLVGNGHLFINNDITNCASVTCWTDMAGFLHGDHHDIAFFNSQIWYAGDDGGAWATTVAGNPWNSMNANLPTCEFFAGDLDGLGIFQGGMQDNGMAYSVNIGGNWQMIQGGDGVATEADPQDNGVVIHGQHFNSYIDFFRPSTAAPGNILTVANLATNGIDFLSPFAIIPTDPKLYTGTSAASSFSFTGSTIMLVGQQNPFLVAHNPNGPQNLVQQAGSGISQTIRYIAPVPGDVTSAYADTDLGLFKLSNLSFAGNGTAATLTGGPVNGTNLLGPLAVSPTSSNTLYVSVIGVIAGQKIYKTTDGGSTWTNVSGNLPNTPVNWIVIDPSDPFSIFVATDLGVYEAGDGGVSGEQWERVGNNLPTISVEQVRITSQRKLIAATFGRGLWSMDLPAAPPTPTFTPTPTPCLSSFASPNLDLKIKRIQCSPNQVVYRVAVENNDPSTAVRISDLTVKLWAFDTGITNWQLDNYFSGLLFGGGLNGAQVNGSFTMTAKPFLPACTTNPASSANWEFDVAGSSTQTIPVNGGLWIAGDFGIQPVNLAQNFTPGLSSWFSQAPGGECADTGSSNDITTYFDDPHYALFYQGNLVAERGGTDPNTGTVPCTFICAPGVVSAMTPTATPTPTFTPCPSGAIVSPNLDLKVRMIQCNTDDQAVFRLFVRNNDPSTAVRLSDLTVKMWTYDTTATGWKLDNYFNGNLFPAGGNPASGGTSPFTLSAVPMALCTLNPGHFANWELDVTNNSPQVIPTNGGYFIDGDFGIQRSDAGAFVPGISEWYSQIPSGEGSTCSDTAGNTPTGYFDDAHYALFYRGSLVSEQGGTDPNTGLRPCFCGAPMGSAAPVRGIVGEVEGLRATPTVSPTPTISPTATVGSVAMMAQPNISRGGEPVKFVVSLVRPAQVKLSLLTLTGEHVYSTSLQGNAGTNSLVWTLQNQAKEAVASGLYLYLIQVDDGMTITTKTGKVAVLH